VKSNASSHLTFNMAKWIFSGLFCASLIWALTFSPIKDTASTYLPESQYCNVQSLPLLPNSPIDVWRLSEISMLMKLHHSSGLALLTPQLQTDLLTEVQTLTNWPHVLTPNDLIEIKSLYQDTNSHTCVLNRMWGAFNLINLMILVGLVGMIITFYPCLSVVAEPLLLMLANYALTLFYIMKPYLKVVLGFMCLALIFWGQNCKSHIGFYLSLTGLIALFGNFYHSYSKWSTNARHTHYYHCDAFGQQKPCIDRYTYQLNQETAYSIFMGLMCACLVPVAISHNSQLIGYLAVMSFYAMIRLI
jgi:hypothetical protein